MPNNENKEILEVLLFLYSLLHKVFGREPDTDFLQILTGENTCEAFALLSDEEGDVPDRFVLFLKELRGEFTQKPFMEQLKTEYTRLFIGPTKLPAPPWESVYRSKQGLLFQESTLAVREFYRKFNMLPQDYPHVADDSLALELHFMAKLSEKALDALRADRMEDLNYYLNGQNIFLQSHLLVWVPKFLERMADAPSDLMYPQLALVTDDFLRRDQKVVEEMLSMIGC